MSIITRKAYRSFVNRFEPSVRFTLLVVKLLHNYLGHGGLISEEETDFCGKLLLFALDLLNKLVFLHVVN